MNSLWASPGSSTSSPFLAHLMLKSGIASETPTLTRLAKHKRDQCAQDSWLPQQQLERSNRTSECSSSKGYAWGKWVGEATFLKSDSSPFPQQQKLNVPLVHDGVENLQKAKRERIYILHSIIYASLTFKLDKPPEGLMFRWVRQVVFTLFTWDTKVCEVNVSLNPNNSLLQLCLQSQDVNFQGCSRFFVAVAPSACYYLMVFVEIMGCRLWYQCILEACVFACAKHWQVAIILWIWIKRKLVVCSVNEIKSTTCL